MDQTGGSGIGKAAGELMQEMQKAQAEMQKLEKSSTSASGQAFQDALQQAQGVQQTNAVQATQQATNVLATAKIQATSPSTRVNGAAKAEQSRMADMLERLVNGQDKMEGIMKMALSGRQFTPSELLAMQAGVYKFSQELELTSKVIEKATSGIKQTMNTQV